MKGRPSDRPISPKEVAESIVEPDVPFETVREDWNEYKIDGVMVRMATQSTMSSISQ
jgi:hypothetical protein